MAANEYRFVTRWRAQGTPEDVFEILDDPLSLVRWWPSVYLDVREVEPGDGRGIGRAFSLVTRGWLPYTLRWTFRVTEKAPPTRIVLEASGDLEGHGLWTITPQGPHVEADYDWRVRADKPLLRYLSFLFKPVFAANHRWAMAQGEECLKRELARRRASAPHHVGGSTERRNKIQQ
jgi:hypothetical protein